MADDANLQFAAALRRWRHPDTGLFDFAKDRLKILNKEGNLVPLVFNESQMLLHEAVEDQRRRKGLVRMVGLKGRRQGFCLSPSTRVLTADLQWVAISDLKEGDEVVACDEEPITRAPGGYRAMRTAKIVKKWNTRQKAYRITLEDGRQVVCSGNHRWLSTKSQTQAAWRSIDGTSSNGRSGLKVGDKIRSVTETWEQGDWEDGWYAGMADGEGSFDQTGSGVTLTVHQRDNAAWQRLLAYAQRKGYTFLHQVDRRPAGLIPGRGKLGPQHIHSVAISRMDEMFRLIGQTRPARFLPIRWWEGRRMPDRGWLEIESIEELPEQRLVDVETTTGTFIAEGLVSHNSTYVAARFYWRMMTEFGRKVYILSHQKASTKVLFSMVERFTKYDPFIGVTPPGENNAQMLTFPDTEGSYTVATAGNAEGGRGGETNLFHGCLSPDTWIMTPELRLKRMGDFRVGDMVLTHTNEVAPVSVISRQRKDALSVKMLGCSEALVATPEHKFWTKSGMKELGSLNVGDHLGHPVPILSHDAVAWPYRLEYGCRKGRGGSASIGPDSLPADFNLGRILGLYLAEGTIVRQSETGAASGVIFSVHHKEVARTLEWLAPFRHCWRSEPKAVFRDDSLTATVTVYSRNFGEFVEARCGAKDAKALPAEWTKNADFAHGLVVGYFSGDGGGEMSGTTRRVQAPSTRAGITVGMRDALATLGYGWPAITYRGPGKRHGRQEQAQWTVRVSGIGADRLWAEMGRQPLPRTCKVREPNIRIENGYAWLPITEINSVGNVEVMDFEVDHDDHSYRTLQCAVSNSEFGFWENADKHFASSIQAVSLIKGTEVILESTSGGPTGKFYEMFQQGRSHESLYESVFIPWHKEKGNVWTVPHGFKPSTEAPDDDTPSEADIAKAFGLSDEQIMFRRVKIEELGLLRFKREFPATPDDAWSSIETDTFINPAAVLRARARETKPSGPVIMGVDPAGGGGDRFAVCVRQGNAVVYLQWRNKIDKPEAIAWVSSLIEQFDPDRVNIDSGNIGSYLISDLRSMNPKFNAKIRSVSFGSPSSIKLADRSLVGPENRRAEMWGRVKDWIEDKDGFASIPNLDDLSSDLVAVKQIFRSDHDWLLMSKADMKKAGLRSPDLGDALALTFASKEYFSERQAAAPSIPMAATGVIHADYDDYSSSDGGWMC